MQVILDSSFARPGSAPIWGGKKGEFRDWTIKFVDETLLVNNMGLKLMSLKLFLELRAYKHWLNSHV